MGFRTAPHPPPVEIHGIRGDDEAEDEADLALVLLAGLGFSLAACGSTKKAYVNMGGLGGPAYVVRGTTTIPNVATGDLVRCKGGPSANVPTPGGAVAVGRDRLSPTGTPASSSSLGEIQLTRLRSGSVKVTCTPK